MKRLSSSLFVLVGLALLAPTMSFAQVYPIDWVNNADTSEFGFIAVGGGYTTVFTVSNSGDYETQMNILCKSQNGTELVGTFHDGSFSVSTSQYVPIIPPNSSRQVTFTAAGGQTVGHAYARIPRTSSGAKSATISSGYFFSPTGSTVGQATVLPSQPMIGLAFYAESSSGPGQDTIETGLSLVNWNPASANATITLRGTTGQDIGSCKPILMTAYSQVVGYVRELCQLSNPYEGLVKISSTNPLVGTALRTTMSVTGVYSYSVTPIDSLP